MGVPGAHPRRRGAAAARPRGGDAARGRHRHHLSVRDGQGALLARADRASVRRVGGARARASCVATAAFDAARPGGVGIAGSCRRRRVRRQPAVQFLVELRSHGGAPGSRALGGVRGDGGLDVPHPARLGLGAGDRTRGWPGGRRGGSRPGAGAGPAAAARAAPRRAGVRHARQPGLPRRLHAGHGAARGGLPRGFVRPPGTAARARADSPRRAATPAAVGGPGRAPRIGLAPCAAAGRGARARRVAGGAGRVGVDGRDRRPDRRRRLHRPRAAGLRPRPARADRGDRRRRGPGGGPPHARRCARLARGGRRWRAPRRCSACGCSTG